MACKGKSKMIAKLIEDEKAADTEILVACNFQYGKCTAREINHL